MHIEAVNAELELNLYLLRQISTKSFSKISSIQWVGARTFSIATSNQKNPFYWEVADKDLQKLGRKTNDPIISSFKYQKFIVGLVKEIRSYENNLKYVEKLPVPSFDLFLKIHGSAILKADLEKIGVLKIFPLMHSKSENVCIVLDKNAGDQAEIKKGIIDLLARHEEPRSKL